MYTYIKDYRGEDPFFYFETENKLTYYVSFKYIPQENYPFNKLYSLDFGELNKLKARKDTKISITILNIIIEFLKEDNYRVPPFNNLTQQI